MGPVHTEGLQIAHLESFLGGQHGSQALARARAALGNTALEPDTALKVRAGIAELRRVVAIRDRYSARDDTRVRGIGRERMP